MIYEEYAKRYCCEDLSLVENYDKAVSDTENIWHCHHRRETDEGLSYIELKNRGLYFNRPASELIFLTAHEHISLHQKGRIHTKEHTQNQAITQYGDKNHHARAVYQLDYKTETVIRKWKCLRDASRSLGIHHVGISNCCRGIVHKAGGFKWVYADKYVPRTKSISDIKPLF